MSLKYDIYLYAVQFLLLKELYWSEFNCGSALLLWTLLWNKWCHYNNNRIFKSKSSVEVQIQYSHNAKHEMTLILMSLKLLYVPSLSSFLVATCNLNISIKDSVFCLPLIVTIYCSRHHYCYMWKYMGQKRNIYRNFRGDTWRKETSWRTPKYKGKYAIALYLKHEVNRIRVRARYILRKIRNSGGLL
jgi:hypothetical protein